MDEPQKKKAKWKISYAGAITLIAVMFLAAWMGWKHLQPEMVVSENFMAIAEGLQSDKIAPQSDQGSGDPEILVHVAGEVLAPGVVELPLGSRVKDAIEAAGGAKQEAELHSINLARLVADGEQILVGDGVQPLQETPGGVPTSVGNLGLANSCVDLNQADLVGLQELNGVGPALAQRILEHRDTFGPFASNQGLLEVSGIGAKTLERIIGQLC